MKKRTAARTQKAHAVLPREVWEPQAQPLLSPQRAFVVQFRTLPRAAPELFCGRVEHLVSGHAARFSSAEELLAVLTQILSTVQD